MMNKYVIDSTRNYASDSPEYDGFSPARCVPTLAEQYPFCAVSLDHDDENPIKVYGKSANSVRESMERFFSKYREDESG